MDFKQKLNNLTITRKVWGLYLFLGSAIVGGVILFSLLIQQLNHQMNGLADVQIPAVRNMTLVDMMHDGLRAVVLESILVSQNPTDESIKTIRAEATEKSENMNKYINEFLAIEVEAKIKKEAAHAIPQVQEYTKLAGKMVQLTTTGASKSQINQLKVEFDKQFEVLETSLGELGDDISKSAETEKTKSHTLAKWSMIGVVAVGSFVIFFATIVVFMFTKNLKNRVDPLMGLISQIEKSNFKHKVVDYSEDELGQLHRSIVSMGVKIEESFSSARLALQNAQTAEESANTAKVKAESSEQEALIAKKAAEVAQAEAQKAFIQVNKEKEKAEEAMVQANELKRAAENASQEAIKLSQKIKSDNEILNSKVQTILDCVDKMAQGDLTVHIPLDNTDAIGKVADKLNSFTLSLKEKMLSIKLAIRNLEQAGRDVNNVSRTLQSSQEMTNSEMSRVAQSTDQVNKLLQTVSAATEEMMSSITELSRVNQESTQVVSTTNIKIDESASLVDQLSRSSNQISEVLNVIKTLSEQTNLLALNATIEAARAGESGRGFAVVASEIKELANETNKATVSIEESIEKIQNDSKKVIQSIYGLKENYGAVSNLSYSISAALEEQVATSSSISVSMNDSAAEVGTIANSILGVKKVVDKNGTSVNQSGVVAHNLSSVSKDLSLLVSTFVIDESLIKKAA